MDLRELELFAHLANSLHYASTSNACGISPSALSRSIQRIEEETGHRLFLRDNRNVELTLSGRKFLEFAEKTLNEYRAVKDYFRQQEETLRGTLRLYCSVTATYTVLTELLGNFQKQYPEVHIDLRTGSAADAVTEVLNGFTDVSIAAKPDRLRESLVFRELAVTPLHFVMPAKECPVRDSVLKGESWEKIPFILSESGIARERIDRWFRHNHLHPEIYARVSGNEAIIAMIGLGLGIGVVPGLVLDKSPMKNDIKVIEDAPKLVPYTVGICAPKRLMDSPIVKAFWNSF